jgi:hypothetical protein
MVVAVQLLDLAYLLFARLVRLVPTYLPTYLPI